MSLNNNIEITTPVLNNITRVSRIFSFDDSYKGYSSITVSVHADQNLILKLEQTYNRNINFNSIEIKNYNASNGIMLFEFKKQGVLARFTLTNNSGIDCTFTHAFADFKYNESVSTTLNNISVFTDLTHNKLDTVNSNLTTINSTLNSGISSMDTITHNKLDTVNSNLTTINSTLNTGISSMDTITHNKLDTIDNKLDNLSNINDNTNTTAQNTAVLAVNSNNIFNKLDTINSNLTVIDNTLNTGISSTDTITHSGLSNITSILLAGITVNNTDFGVLSDINTTLNTILNTGISSTDTITHNKLDTVNSNLTTINTTLNTGISSTDTITHDKLDTINTALVVTSQNTGDIVVNTQNTVTELMINNNRLFNLDQTNELTNTKLDAINVKLNELIQFAKFEEHAMISAYLFNLVGNTPQFIVGSAGARVKSINYSSSDSTRGSVHLYDSGSDTSPNIATAVPKISLMIANNTNTLKTSEGYILFESGIWVRAIRGANPFLTSASSHSENGVTITYYLPIL